MSEGTLWPRTESDLRARFRQAAFYPEESPDRGQAKLLLELLASYEKKDLAPATRPLCSCCPHRKRCWSGAEDRRRTPTDSLPEDGGIIMPWVGSRYRAEAADSLVVIAINPNIDSDDRTFLLSEHELSWKYHSSLEEGNKELAFAYRMLRSAAAVLDFADKAKITDREQPQDLVDSLHRTARLQAVKCVPRGERSRPTRAMDHICPSFLLEREIEILRPRLILTLGTTPDAAVAHLPGYDYREELSTEYLWRHRLYSEWGQVEVFAIYHPAAPGGLWHLSHLDLVAALQAESSET